LGVINLSDVIDEVSVGAENQNDKSKIPKLTTEVKDEILKTILEWKPLVKEWSIGMFTISFEKLDDALELEIEIVSGKDTESKVDVKGTLKNCTITLKEIISVKINEVTFSNPWKKKMEVSADIGEIKFEGPLNFVNNLKEKIPALGFKDGPRIDVTTEEVLVGYSLPIPGIAAGAFTMDNIRLISNLKLPFKDGGELTYEFAFSDRSDPFIVTVSMLGGGGFFMFRMNIKEIVFFSVQVEFGAASSINLGSVASGTLQVMAGIYLEKDVSSNKVPMEGFLRAKGEIEVLGLINASVEFYMGLTWPSENTASHWKIVGTATVTVEVDTLFFSKDVSLTYVREYEYDANRGLRDGTGLKGIRIENMMTEHQWLEYCKAFIPLLEVA
jgi:hypothetical protein